MNTDLVVTGGFTLAGALGAVGLTQHRTAKREHITRIEARRGEQRQVLSDVLIAGRLKILLYNPPTLMLLGRMDLAEMAKFTDTDSGKNMGSANKDLERGLTNARMLIGDPALAETLAELRVLNDAFSVEVVGRAMTGKKPGGEADARAAIQHIEKVRSAINRLEIQAVEILRVAVAVPDRPGRVRVFARKVSAAYRGIRSRK